MPGNRFRIVSLGCAKNLVDSEVMAGLLAREGWIYDPEAEDVDLVLVNTCSFIDRAREESGEIVLEQIERKRMGLTRLLVVAGCMPRMFGEKMADAFPEVDLFLGPGEVHRIGEGVARLLAGEECESIRPRWPRYLYDHRTPRLFLEGSHAVYLKISEGCSNACTYCTIQRLRGSHRSRDPRSVVQEAVRLIARGAREINLIGQDTTAFGTDLSPPMSLADLLESVLEVSGDCWVRLLYTHPARVDDRLLDLLASENSLCRYLDLPIQHACDRILSDMGRPTTKAQIRGLIERARQRIPGVALRTSIIVGFPGETEEEFEELAEFIRWARFDRLGVFGYSREEGTAVARMPGQVPADRIRQRQDHLLALQAEISEQINQGHVGKVLPALVDAEDPDEPGLFLCRTELSAPDVDGVVLVHSPGLTPGQRIRVRIDDALTYDLTGTVEP